MLKRLGLGMLVTLLLMTAAKVIEHMPLGHRIETATFEILQWPLSQSRRELPVVVINMSDVPRDANQVTSRVAIRQTLDAIVAQRPLAVGIDLDFAPTDNDWSSPDDPAFFEYCLKLKRETGVPIYLGVFRTIKDGPEAWLGLEDYREMATALTASDDTKRLPLWLQPKNSTERLPTLGAALADTYKSTQVEPASFFAWVVETTVDSKPGIERQGEDSMLFGESLVNYSKLEEIQLSTIKGISPQAIAGARESITGKVVLLGDATRFEDPFCVPGHERPIPGVYLLACVVYTMAVEPLYELNVPLRLLFDLGVSIFLMLIVEALRVRYVNKRPGTKFFAARSKALWMTIGCISLAALLIVRLTNIMWFDIPFIAFALLLHPKIEHWFDRVWKRLRRKPKRRLNRPRDPRLAEP